MNAISLKVSTFAVLAISLVPATFAQPGTINTVVGNGYKGRLGIGGPATTAEMYGPNSVAVDKAGNLFVVDYTGEYIYKVDAAGDISIYAGNGAGGYSGDGGKAINATFNQPRAIAFGPGGNLFVADSNNNAIRKIDTSNRTIKTVAGNGAGAGPGDMDICSPTVAGTKATATPICNSQSVAVDSAGNFYFTSYQMSGTQIMKVTASTGIITVVAGNGGYGYTGDGGPAVSATLAYAASVAVDSGGNLYIADTGNCAIRKVNAATGMITSLVGVPLHPWQGTCGLSGDGGPASAALINLPTGLTV